MKKCQAIVIAGSALLSSCKTNIAHYLKSIKDINTKLKILAPYDKMQLQDKEHKSERYNFGVMPLLQVITMTSPSAMIWNNLSEGRSSSPYCGSPLDVLPCSPSCLPMPPSEQNNQVKVKWLFFTIEIFLFSILIELFKYYYL